MIRQFKTDQYVCSMRREECPMNAYNNNCIAYECQHMVLDHVIAEDCIKKEVEEMELKLAESMRFKR